MLNELQLKYLNAKKYTETLTEDFESNRWELAYKIQLDIGLELIDWIKKEFCSQLEKKELATVKDILEHFSTLDRIKKEQILNMIAKSDVFTIMQQSL